MEQILPLMPKGHGKIQQLMDKGVEIPNPLTLDVGDEVNAGHISGKGVKIYPGCRIYGGKTVIAQGAQIGREGPVTIEDCRIGPFVELNGGYFTQAVFLERVTMGFGAHVREGCLLEERAGGAHCVGLKQTILFPFVTLGSLINFCDCLMAGGTGPKDHSEVGSSYIHFNFTPNGDKATPSMFGDVPEGVMLNQPPIFLGGQGGAVGPLRLGFGNVAASGTILRKDVLDRRKLIIGKAYRGGVVPFVPNQYGGVPRVVENNLIYLANLSALIQWYIQVRQSFFSSRELDDLILAGALENLAGAIRERLKRLEGMALNMAEFEQEGVKKAVLGRDLSRYMDELDGIFGSEKAAAVGVEARDRFLNGLHQGLEEKGPSYTEVIRGLPPAVTREGTRWLEQIVEHLYRESAKVLSIKPQSEMR
ncbi:MAG: UDP-N-acetylglucosamine pyrophosphorylase [Thermodesulfobacteriota bacterium]